MSDSRRRLHRTMTLLAAMGIAAAVAGCGRTLVFVERDGINFAIRANASSSPPLELNFGLDRVIATIVPPVGESGGQPNGDAVNMFAGFQVAANTDPAKPLAPDVKIDTQFASGAAAKSVAESPPVVAGLVVASIVSPNSGIQRGRISSLRSRIGGSSLRRSVIFPMTRRFPLQGACCQICRQGVRTFRRNWRRSSRFFPGAASSRRRLLGRF